MPLLIHLSVGRQISRLQRNRLKRGKSDKAEACKFRIKFKKVDVTHLSAVKFKMTKVGGERFLSC